MGFVYNLNPHGAKYREISILNVAYNVLKMVMSKKLKPSMENVVGLHKEDFR